MGIDDYLFDILNAPTDRDLQSKVGPSNLSNACTYCLAKQMAGGQESTIYTGQYWLGAKIGTCIHEYAEGHSKHPTVITEQKNVIGTIKGYGTIKGSTDAFFPEEGVVGDIKTTTRDKLKFIKLAVEDEPNEYETSKVTDARVKVSAYQRQLFLYGKGWEDLGYTVNECIIWFVCRDGQGSKDFWTFRFPYRRDHAEATLDRAAKLWAYLEGGGELSALKSAQGCWPCGMEGR